MAHPATTPASYISPLPSKTSFTFVPGTEIYENISITLSGVRFDSLYGIRITNSNGVVFEQGVASNGSGTIGPNNAQGYTEQSLIPGIYTVYYAFSYPVEINGGVSRRTNTATYQFLVIENRLPMKKWTATDVINRLFDICEPIRRGDKPRFRLQGMSEEGAYCSILPCCNRTGNASVLSNSIDLNSSLSTDFLFCFCQFLCLQSTMSDINSRKTA